MLHCVPGLRRGDDLGLLYYRVNRISNTIEIAFKSLNTVESKISPLDLKHGDLAPKK
jgi:hypothetical protein